jgi:hypothetical protein
MTLVDYLLDPKSWVFWPPLKSVTSWWVHIFEKPKHGHNRDRKEHWKGIILYHFYQDKHCKRYIFYTFSIQIIKQQMISQFRGGLHFKVMTEYDFTKITDSSNDHISSVLIWSHKIRHKLQLDSGSSSLLSRSQLGPNTTKDLAYNGAPHQTQGHKLGYKMKESRTQSSPRSIWIQQLQSANWRGAADRRKSEGSSVENGAGLCRAYSPGAHARKEEE